ncbi:MAG TPA: CheR family methyltransferase, partial [Thermoguttaceae bacterium]|nr:CheR family methyltransferase [Thermoguttaceae bacterium]
MIFRIVLESSATRTRVPIVFPHSRFSKGETLATSTRRWRPRTLPKHRSIRRFVKRRRGGKFPLSGWSQLWRPARWRRNFLPPPGEIYDRTGIRVSPQKKTLLSNRLRRRLKQTGIEDFGEYYRHLKGLRPNDPEWDLLLQEITTHETYLFRDEAQWDWFRNTFLPQCASEVRSGTAQRSLRVWSAACSTGDE